MTQSLRRTVTHRLIWDMVVPLAPIVGNTFEVLDRFQAAGHSFVSLTLAGDDCGLAEATHRLAGARAAIARRPDFVLARTARDVTRAYDTGQMAVGLHLEGTECLERDPDVLNLFYELGIRHAILAFNMNNSAAGGCADIGDVGLSRLGRRYIDRMRSLGMLLDVSHMGERSSLEAIDAIGAPVVFTHSNARGVHDHWRNVSDAQAKACAASGGLVGMSGSSVYLGACDSLAEGLFRHVDYLVQMIGPDHVGLGTDYIVDTAAMEAIFAERPDEWPTNGVGEFDNLAYLPPEEIAQVIRRFEMAGYAEEDIRKILGGNYLRIAAEVWR
jgi:membrane dipeptidase